MRTIMTKVYKFDELGDDAKKYAIQKYRDMGLDYDWWDVVYEDFTMICACLGVTINTYTVSLVNGKTRQKPAIYFSGFSGQGDGACFEGRYDFQKTWRKALKEYAPMVKELFRIGKVLAECKASARIRHNGNYYNKYCMLVEVLDAEGNECTSDVHSTVTKCMRDLADWLYNELEREYQCQISDEHISEMLKCNEYEFTKEGKRI